MIPIIYQDRAITITRDFISRPGRETETIRIREISEVRITRRSTGDYKAGAILFFVIGLLTVYFVIGWGLLVMAIAAWNTSKFEYSLVVVVYDRPWTLLTRKRKSSLKSLARTISGLSLSRNVLAATA